jgi:hypothetical protein
MQCIYVYIHSKCNISEMKGVYHTPAAHHIVTCVHDMQEKKAHDISGYQRPDTC